MTRLITILLITFCLYSQGQSLDKLVFKGDYSGTDSTQMIATYMIANQAVMSRNSGMNDIWDVVPQRGQSKKVLRIEKWRNDPAFMTWLGQPEKIGLARRKIKAIHSKFKKKLILEVTKENKGRCKGWIGAWAIPYGRVKIKLCEEFFITRSHHPCISRLARGVGKSGPMSYQGVSS